MNNAKLAALAAATTLLLTACGDPETANDAPAIPAQVTGPAEILPMPDGFSNAATRCDGHGNRIYTIYRTWATGAHPAYGAIAVGPDTDGTCKVAPR